MVRTRTILVGATISLNTVYRIVLYSLLRIASLNVPYSTCTVRIILLTYKTLLYRTVCRSNDATVLLLSYFVVAT